MPDFDKLLEELGQFGRYQVFTYFLLFFPLGAFTISSMTYVFTTADTDYRCAVPQCENDTQIYEQPWLRDAIPFKNGEIVDHCLRYKAILNSSYETCLSATFSNETEECDRYVFGNDLRTITKDFNLPCERNNWKRSLVGTVGNVAMVSAMPIAGVLSDRFGRKILIVWSLILTGLSGILRSFSTTYLQYIICDALDGIFHSGLFNAVFIFGAEIVGPDMRGLGGALVNVYFTLGEIILGAIVWLFNDWHIYLRILYVPFFIIGILFHWILPESVRWLMAHGKDEKVTETIDHIARWNKKTRNIEIINSIEGLCLNGSKKVSIENGQSQKERVSSSFIEVLRSKTIMLRVLNCSYCWFASAAVFYGLSVYAVTIAGNKFLNFILVSAVELPGCIACYFLVNYGRRFSLCLGLSVSGAACLAFHFIPQASSIGLVIYFIGKMAITLSFSAMCILASEFFPTEYRNTLFGFCSTISLFGAITAPQVPLLAKYVDPVLVFSALALSAAALTLFFPETRNCGMPESLKDAKNMGKKGRS